MIAGTIDAVCNRAAVEEVVLELDVLGEMEPELRFETLHARLLRTIDDARHDEGIRAEIAIAEYGAPRLAAPRAAIVRELHVIGLVLEMLVAVRVECCEVEVLREVLAEVNGPDAERAVALVVGIGILQCVVADAGRRAIREVMLDGAANDIEVAVMENGAAIAVFCFFEIAQVAAAMEEARPGRGEVCVFLMELAGLEGRKKLEKYDVASVITYEGK